MIDQPFLKHEWGAETPDWHGRRCFRCGWMQSNAEMASETYGGRQEPCLSPHEAARKFLEARPNVVSTLHITEGHAHRMIREYDKLWDILSRCMDELDDEWSFAANPYRIELGLTERLCEHGFAISECDNKVCADRP